MWEGRHWSSLAQTARYLLTCMRYIELNPVRAGTVRRPEEYRWSSYGAHTWGDHHWLTPHPEYQRLGTAPARRWVAYRELFKTLLHEEDLYLVRRH